MSVGAIQPSKMDMDTSASNLHKTSVKLLKRGTAGATSLKDMDVEEALNTLNGNGNYPAADYEDYGVSSKFDIGGGGGGGYAGGSDGYGDAAGYGGGGGYNIERSSGYGHSGHGHGGYGHKKLECCELVVDPLTFASLLAGILGGTAFLNVVITMVLGRKRRRRRSFSDSDSVGDGSVKQQLFDVFNLGESVPTAWKQVWQTCCVRGKVHFLMHF